MLPAAPVAGDVLLDRGVAHPEVNGLRAALRTRDWSGVRVIADAADPALRSGLVSVAADEAGELCGEEFLRYVLARDPDDSLASAILGGLLITTGWKVRTSARASNVSRAQFDVFHDYLRKAEQVLMDGAARTPADPAIWVQRIIIARALQLGLSEGRRRWDRLAVVDPQHLAGQIQLLQLLCPKWAGTWELAHGFARECMLAAPPGSLNARLVADAHLEHASDLDTPQSAAYLNSPQVRHELHEAARHSVWHPQFRRTYGWVGAASSFAMMFSVIGDQPAAASLFSMLGPLATESPWDTLGDPAEQIRAARARAFGKGAGR